MDRSQSFGIGVVCLFLISFITGTGWTINVPSATTGAATNITENGATLNGVSNPNGSGFLQYMFAWGLTENHDKYTEAKDVPGGTSNIACTAAIAGLKPDTTYHFQLWARGESGFWERGKDMTFKTAGKPIALTKAATDLAPNFARLHGTVNPNGLMTTHYWQYGPTTAYGTKTPT